MLRELRPGNSWLGPLLAIVLLQSTGAFLVQLLPVLAPVMSEAIGWPQWAIGFLAALSMLGSMGFLLFGLPLTRIAGPIRSVQIGLGVGLLGIAALLAPFPGAPVLTSLLVGLAYGATMPSGSLILQKYAPPRHRSLIFSVKQAAVPLGAAVAGLALPFAASLGGWRAALLLAGAVVIASILLVQPARSAIDADRPTRPREGKRRRSRFAALAEPMAALGTAPGLLRLAFAGACLAATQGSWNAVMVSYLVGDAGLTLAVAGVLFSLMQAAAIVGRLALGVAADRLGSGRLVIRGAAAVSGLSSLALVYFPGALPLWATAALLAVAGASTSGWNGVHLAELAKRAPAGQVAEVSAGGMLLVSFGLMGGPFATAALLAVTGRYELALSCVAILPMLAFVLLRGPDPSGRGSAGPG